MSGVDMGPTTDAPDLENLTHADRVEAMVAWFHENFEDPAQTTPYETAEGGYQWIWGGPYDPAEELYNEFGGEATDEDVEAASEEIKSDGLYEWAPHQSRMYEVPEDEPPLGERLQQLRGDLDDLEIAIGHLREDAPMMGHNQPPEDMRIGLDQRDLDEALESIGEIRAELDSQNPQSDAHVLVVQKAESRFRSIAEKVRSWAMIVGKWIVEGAIGEVGVELWQNPVALYHKVEAIGDTLGAWAHVLQSLL